MAAPYDLNLRDYWHVLRKRRAIVIGVTLLLCALSLLFSYLFHETVQYRATASVKIEKITTPAGLFIEAFSLANGDPVATQAFVIKSYPVIARAAKKMGLVGQEVSAEEIQQTPALLKTIASLTGMIHTEREQSTDIVHIIATADDPTFAQRLANATAGAFREYSLVEANKRVLEAKGYIETQLASVQVRLKEAEEKLKTFRETHALVAIDTQATASLSELAAVEKDLYAIREQRKALATLLSSLREQKVPPHL